MRKISDPLANLLARGVRTEQGCLVLPSKDLTRYATMKANGRTVKVHRFVYEQEHGPTDLYICHTCDVPGCFAVEHLFAGSQSDNMLDMYAKQRRVPVRKPRAEPVPPVPRDQSGDRNPNWKGGVTLNMAEWHRQRRASLTEEQREERRRRDREQTRVRRARLKDLT